MLYVLPFLILWDILLKVYYNMNIFFCQIIMVLSQNEWVIDNPRL